MANAVKFTSSYRIPPKFEAVIWTDRQPCQSRRESTETTKASPCPVGIMSTAPSANLAGTTPRGSGPATPAPLSPWALDLDSLNEMEFGNITGGLYASKLKFVGILGGILRFVCNGIREYARVDLKGIRWWGRRCGFLFYDLDKGTRLPRVNIFFT